MNARDVAKQSRAKREHLAAILAGKILWGQVRLHVDLQRDFVMIALLAICATVRSDALVNVVMLGQVKFGFESLRALRTLYRPGIGVRASYVFHHVGLADKLGVADDTRKLPNAEVCLHVYRAFVTALVELKAELARVTVLRVVHHVFHIVVHLDLLAVDLEELLRILRGFQPLFQIRQILHHRAVVLRGRVAENVVDNTVHLHVVFISQQIRDRHVDQRIALIGKHSRSYC